MVLADANWDAAKGALAICAKTYPNTKTAKEALKAAGWRYHGVQGDMHLYSQNGYRAVAAINAGKMNSPRCLVTASKMPPAFAMEIAKPVLNTLKGSNELPPLSRIKRWSGAYNGQKTVVGVFEKLELGLLRGAAVGFVGE